MTDRAKHYDRQYFTGNQYTAGQIFNQGRLRDDEFAVLNYACGGTEYVLTPEVAFAEQVDILKLTKRRGGLVLDIGCGRGMVAAALSCLSFRVYAIDFSPAAVSLTRETIETRGYPGLAQTWQLGIKDIHTIKTRPDTVILCESIEHMPGEEFDIGFGTILEWKPLLIIANKIDWHPITPDGGGWNHITRIDDALYDRIAGHGETVFRRGSHLVVQL